MSQPCPRCHSLAYCKETRKGEHGVVVRRFYCTECDCRFRSEEVVTHIEGMDLAAPKNHLKQLSELLLASLTSQGYLITRKGARNA